MLFRHCPFLFENRRDEVMEKLNDVITAIDDFVWGPVMLILPVGTGIFLTIRTRFLTWRNIGIIVTGKQIGRAHV